MMQSRGAVSYEIVVASAHGGLVTSEPGLATMTQPLAALSDSEIDTIIVVGGVIPADGAPAGELAFPPGLGSWVAEHAPPGRQSSGDPDGPAALEPQAVPCADGTAALSSLDAGVYLPGELARIITMCR